MTQLAAATGWHFGATVEGLRSAGLLPAEAEAYAAFVFAARAGGDGSSVLCDGLRGRLRRTGTTWSIGEGPATG